MSRDALDQLAAARPARLEPSAIHAPEAVAAILAQATPHRPGRRLALVLGSAGLTATAAAVAAVMVSTGGTTAVTPPPQQEQTPKVLSAGQILLAAADRSTGTGLGDGRYLVVRQENGNVEPIAGPGKSLYAMLGKSTTETWLTRSGRGDSVQVSRKLGYVPASPADAKVWRGLGSPTDVRVLKPTPDGAKGPGSPISTRPGKRERSTFPGSDIYAIGERNVTLADLEKLPTEPAALRRHLLSLYRGGGGDLPTDRDEWLLTMVSGVVVGLPVSGAVRAAAYRLIADLPGVRALGAYRDQRGRTGEAVSFTWRYKNLGKNAGAIEERLVIDPATGRALSREAWVAEPAEAQTWVRKGGLSGYELVLGTETTDSAPPA